jgi:hypothetical protein
MYDYYVFDGARLATRRWWVRTRVSSSEHHLDEDHEDVEHDQGYCARGDGRERTG